jgi:hypothetical protein
VTGADLSREDRVVLVRRYRAGAPITKLGADYGVPPPSVLAILIEEGVPLRGQDAAVSTMSGKERNAEIVRLRQVYRMTYQDIGDRFLITKERVRQILKENGVDPRYPHAFKDKPRT